MKNLDLVILAGGKGTSIKKYLHNNPKPMVKFNEIFFLQYLINIYSKYPSNKIFILTGYKKNIYKYINNSAGLICSSLWEEPGFVIQEAAACRKIILTSDCYTGPSEFLNHGKNGYVFKNNDQKSFVKNFKKLLLEKKYHKKKINESFKSTQFYTPNYFLSEIKKILN